MNDTISELLKFSDGILETGFPILDDRIEMFEQKYGLRVPGVFKAFVSQINGFNLMGTEVYGFDSNKDQSLESVYHFEHFEVIVPQYPYLIPFSDDGRGNFYCLDTHRQTGEHDCPIVFWVSNYPYSPTDAPETVNNGFIEWVNEVVIQWVLEDYNYDGSEK